MTAPRSPRPSARLALAVAFAFALALGHGTNAAGQGAVDVSIVDVDDTAFPEVSLIISVEDGGRPVSELTADQLSVRESGSATTVLELVPVTDATIPLALVLALDVSGSVEGETLQREIESATALVVRLAPGDEAAVLTFADDVRILQPLTTSKDALRSAAAALEAGGNTTLHDAVHAAAGIASDSTFSRRAVLLLTDGEEFGERSAFTRDEALAEAESSGALFYVIGVGPDADRAFLEELAERTGGGFFVADAAGDIPAIYEAIESRLRSQFVVRVASSAAADARERSVEVTATVGGVPTTVTRSYQTRRLEAPAPTPTAHRPQPAPVPTVALDTGTPSSSSSPWPSLLGGFAVVAVLTVGLVAWRARRRERRAGAATARSPLPRPGLARSPSAGGLLQVVDGPEAGAELVVGREPLLVGSGARCQLRLDAAGVAPEQARLWWRDGRLMVHDLSPGGTTLLRGRPVVWASLADGDEVTLGSVVLRYTAARSNGDRPDARAVVGGPA